MPGSVQVVRYSPEWPQAFDRIAGNLRRHPLLAQVPIEHVGSTSVAGLAAKPVIDIDVVARDSKHSTELITALGEMGYRHRGDLGITGREAFDSADQPELARHNLYLCIAGGLPLRNHMLLRDILRIDAELCRHYGELKQTLARRYPADIDRYCEAKSEFILGVLKRCGMGPAELQQIHDENVLQS